MTAKEQYLAKDMQDLGKTLAHILPGVRKAVFSNSIGMGFTSSEVEDIIQDTLVVLARNLPQLKHVHNVNRYIETLARNRLLNSMRQRRRSKEEFAADAIQYLTSKSTSSEEAETEVALEALSRALQTLRPDVRIAIQLHFIDGMQVDQIARYLGTRSPNVKKFLVQGMLALKAALTGTNRDLLAKRRPSGSST